MCGAVAGFCRNPGDRNDRKWVVAVELVRNSSYSRYTHNIEPVRIAEGLDVGMRETRESRVTPECLA